MYVKKMKIKMLRSLRLYLFEKDQNPWLKRHDLIDNKFGQFGRLTQKLGKECFKNV